MDYTNIVLIIRARLNMTQQELAEILKVSFATVNRWENGKNVPTMKIKRVLHKMFDDNKL